MKRNKLNKIKNIFNFIFHKINHFNTNFDYLFILFFKYIILLSNLIKYFIDYQRKNKNYKIIKYNNYFIN